MTVWVLGFDLSLTAPAAVALPLDWRPGDWKRVKSWLGAPPAPEGQDDLGGRVDRYLTIVDWAETIVRDLCGRGPKAAAELRCYVEAYGFSKNNAHASQIQESGGAVKAELRRHYRLVLKPVPSSTARKLTIGFNPRKPNHDAKTVVQDTVFNKFKGPKSWGENECDAFIVAQFGLSEEGGRILTLAEG